MGYQQVPAGKLCSGLLVSIHPGLLVNFPRNIQYITFHCFRHTYATLQLSLGTDIYTVSKLLGHRELKTTQIYAKVVDKAKREAANRIKLDFDAINRE